MIRMIGTMQRGLYIIFHLVLVLTTNQLAKFTCGSEIFGRVSVHNFDKQALSSRSFLDRLVKHSVSTLLDTSRTVFVSILR